MQACPRACPGVHTRVSAHGEVNNGAAVRADVLRRRELREAVRPRGASCLGMSSRLHPGRALGSVESFRVYVGARATLERSPRCPVCRGSCSPRVSAGP